jgi:cysteine desulfuration protein SufE
MDTPQEIQEHVIAVFRDAGDAFNQFTYLLQLAGELPELPEVRKTDDVLVSGCQSQVWLDVSVNDGRLRIEGDSDTLMVRGIIRILVLMFDGQTADAVYDTDIDFVEQTELVGIFDSKRKAGVSSIMQSIKEVAACGIRE